VGHQLKGNAVTFEIPQIAYIGHEMERAAQRKDVEKLKGLIKKLQSSLESVRGHWLGSDSQKEDFNDLRS
jgi:HPt (histidine-containing phosphotransfer) domain-containing protein